MNSVHNPVYDPGLEARFAVASRHSRMVRVLRIAVPVAVALAMTGLIYKAVFGNPFQIEVKTDNLSGNLVVSGSKITMETPHLTGFTPDQRPYDLVAHSAVQDLTDPDHVQLNILRAKVLMEDQSTVTLRARTGIFDTKQQLLDLYKDVVMTTSTGYEAHLSEAHADMGKGTVSSDQHVDVKLTNGTLTADRLRITDNGDVVRFEGNVVMHLENLDGGNAGPSAQPAERAADATPTQRTRPVKSTNAK
ncbi:MULTISPECIES: LPS export ABC transporter periplasmic protein LptC [unclassified Bradyrhizobium]|uniref:LPS export ABC transporter periplasmic protein LptC n=1 Tax=unclassified Bradyrhizobium TaxID=2631580 RepID=UPI0029168A1A|nr:MULTISPECIES: LPS export ABC transporter periplasmic protein LptC [unclassified Bradyrhizobium]